MKVIQITRQKFIELFQNHKGATMGQVVQVTEPRWTGGQKSPMAKLGIMKSSSTNVTFNGNYVKGVQRRAEKSGNGEQAKNFKAAKAPSYTRFGEGSMFGTSNKDGAAMLIYQVNKNAKTMRQFFMPDGSECPEAANYVYIAPSPKKQIAAGVSEENILEWRGVRLENVKSVTMNHIMYQFV